MPCATTLHAEETMLLLTSWHAMSCHFLQCHLMPPHVMPRFVVHVMPRFVANVMPRFVAHVMPRFVAQATLVKTRNTMTDTLCSPVLRSTRLSSRGSGCIWSHMLGVLGDWLSHVITRPVLQSQSVQSWFFHHNDLLVIPSHLLRLIGFIFGFILTHFGSLHAPWRRRLYIAATKGLSQAGPPDLCLLLFITKLLAPSSTPCACLDHPCCMYMPVFTMFSWLHSWLACLVHAVHSMPCSWPSCLVHAIHFHAMLLFLPYVHVGHSFPCHATFHALCSCHSFSCHATSNFHAMFMFFPIFMQCSCQCFDSFVQVHGWPIHLLASQTCMIGKVHFMQKHVTNNQCWSKC